MFTLEISTWNDVFRPSPNAEIARILRCLADKLDRGEVFSGAALREKSYLQYATVHVVWPVYIFFDGNGNNVGEAYLTGEQP